MEPRSKRDSKGGLTTAEEEGNAAGGCPPQVDVYEKGSATRIHIELRKFLICQTAVGRLLTCRRRPVWPRSRSFSGTEGGGGASRRGVSFLGPRGEGGGKGKGMFFCPSDQRRPLVMDTFSGGREGGGFDEVGKDSPIVLSYSYTLFRQRKSRKDFEKKPPLRIRSGQKLSNPSLFLLRVSPDTCSPSP